MQIKRKQEIFERGSLRHRLFIGPAGLCSGEIRLEGQAVLPLRTEGIAVLTAPALVLVLREAPGNPLYVPLRRLGGFA